METETCIAIQNLTNYFFDPEKIIKTEFYQALLGYTALDIINFAEKIEVNPNNRVLLFGVHSLALVDSLKSENINSISYQIENSTLEILASDMSITNIRMFIEVIPEDQHNKIVNQYIIRDDSKYLVFADNATTRLYLPKFPLFE